MNRRLLILVTAPTVLIGLLLFLSCLAGAWYINRMQTNLSNILASNIASMQAAQQLETNVRQLRFFSFSFLIDPHPSQIKEIEKAEFLFQKGLDLAESTAFTPKEKDTVKAIREGFQRYQHELEELRKDVEREGPRRDLRNLVDSHPVRHVVEICRDFSRQNEEQIGEIVQETQALSARLHWMLLLLGLIGPLGGILSGYGIARGLSQSLYRLSVSVYDMAQQLEREVGAVKLMPGADLQGLEHQLQLVMERMAGVMDRYQRQQQEMLRAQQLAAVGQLAASVAHEVRNPLTGIKLLVEASLRASRPKPFTQENLRIIHGEILRLEKTVQNFLDFARPPGLKRESTDLREIIERALELTRARAQNQKIQVQARLPSHPIFMEVDRQQLGNVAVNLLINAMDAMPQGGRLEVELYEAPPGKILLKVSDSGEGIAHGMVDQLFTPFVSTKPTGSGLGLNISKRIVEEHQGEISGGNRPDGGACFTVILPRSVEAPHAAPARGR